jgi:hypothetical protein
MEMPLFAGWDNFNGGSAVVVEVGRRLVGYGGGGEVQFGEEGEVVFNLPATLRRLRIVKHNLHRHARTIVRPFQCPVDLFPGKLR